MTSNTSTSRGKLRRAASFGKWGPATAVVVTEAVQTYFPDEPGVGLIDHLHSGAYWGLAVQLVSMGAAKIWQKLKDGISITAITTISVGGKQFPQGPNSTPPADITAVPGEVIAPPAASVNGSTLQIGTSPAMPETGTHDTR
ncbi:hypothetical protein [Streptomyces cyaneofuscatus]|uniref:hypothetical protein n=1 Tax=Streptomyces cyaneofuscatus TaxID=66883 RepID=UPI0033A3020C